MNNRFITLYSRLNVFWLLHFPLFLFVFLRFLQYAPISSDSLSVCYFILLSIAQAGLISWMLLVFIPTAIYWLSFKKISPLIIASLIVPFALFFLFVDGFIYSQFHLHLQWVFLQMILSPARSQIFNLTLNEGLSLALVFSIFTVLMFILLQVCRHNFQRLSVFSFWGQGLIILFVVLVQAIHVWADAVYEPRLLVATELSPWFRGATAKRFFERHHWVDTAKRPVKVSSLSKKSALNYPLHPLQTKPMAKKPNILMITIDAWRADSMTNTITPHIATFTESADVYQNHFSGGNSTRAGIFSLFYSLSPTLFDTFYREARGPLLFDVLLKEGYAVNAYTSASALSPPFHRTVFANLPKFNPNMPGSDSIERDRNLTQQIISSIKNAQTTKQPFFVFGFYDSAHAYNYPGLPFKAPFQPSEHVSRLKLKDPSNELLMRNQYNNALYFIDQLVGELLEHLKEQNLLENTIVIITGDHGEEFDDNHQGFWGHNSNFTPVQTQVPFIVHWPQQHHGAKIKYITSHYDLVPTLLKKTLGISNPISDYSIGKLLNDSTLPEIILMGNYSDIAAFSSEKKRLAVTNSLGYFQMQSLQGIVLKNEPLDAAMVAQAYRQIQQFSCKMP